MGSTASNDCQRKAHFTFIWTIENASELLISKIIDSPKFIAPSIERTKWRLMVSTFLDCASLDVCLQRDDNNEPDSIEIELEISVLADNGSPLSMETGKGTFPNKDNYQYQRLYLFTEDIFFQRRAEFLPNDTLTIRCRMWGTGTDISKPDTCFARTRMGVDHRSFVWAIREFSSLQPGQKRTRILHPTSNGSPQLILNLFLSENNSTNNVSLQMHQTSETSIPCIFCKYSLLNSDGRVEHTEEMHSFDYKEQSKVLIFFEKDKLVNKQSSLLQNDVLYLRCEIRISAKPVWSRIENYRYLNLEDLEPIEVSEMHLGEPGEAFVASCPFKKAFEYWYEDESLSDVVLRTGATSLPAHKIVLSSRSPVFKAMFKQDMREKTDKIVDIPDFNADTLGRLLLYIYKDTVEDLQWESATELYRAANKYQLLGLRKKCSLILQSYISLTSVCSILSLSDMYDDIDLLKASENFISEHDNEVFNSDEWKNFKDGNLRVLSLVDMHEDSDLRKAAENFISANDNEVFDSDEWINFK